MLDNLHSLTFFIPEIILTLGIVAILVVDLIFARPSVNRSSLITVGTLALALLATLAKMNAQRAVGTFGGLLAQDPMTDFFRIFFIVTTALVGLSALRAKDAIDPESQQKESAEFFALALTTTLGMCLMAASTDLLMAFLSLETVSIMSYILSGYRRRNRASSEASLKYIIYGGVASGVMLYGMSLLYGLSGSTQFGSIYAALQKTPSSLALVAAVVLCLAGFGYKIAAVPFHMWCPDVYQGAPTPVTAFLSVGPKAAGFALLLRFLSALPVQVGTGLEAIEPWPILLSLLAVATMTLGNFAALGQSNIKRLLAYSSIAHAGYLLLGLAVGSADGNRAILVYLVTYLFMNLGAFFVVMALADAGVGESIDDYRQLGKRSPYLAAVMAIFLFSLTGLPPFAGFFGKFYLFYALLARGGTLLVTVAVIGILNSAVSLYYYARILKAMYFDRAAEAVPSALQLSRIYTFPLAALAVPTLLLFLCWSPLVRFVDRSLLQWVHIEPPSVAQWNVPKS